MKEYKWSAKVHKKNKNTGVCCVIGVIFTNIRTIESGYVKVTLTNLLLNLVKYRLLYDLL